MFKHLFFFLISFFVSWTLVEGSDCDYEGWSFKLAPYAWASGLEGDLGTFARLPTVHVDLSFSDILKHLDGALMLAGEIRKGRISLATDLMYTHLSGKIIRSNPEALFSDVSLNTRYWVVTLAFGYEFIKTNCLSMDAYLGGRIWSITNHFSLGTGTLPGRSINGTQRWMDPLVGMRGKLCLCGGFSVLGWGMIGGFDVSSKLFWDVLGALGYTWDFCQSSMELLVGYRYLLVDYRDVDFLFDVRQFGPIVGLVFSF